MDLNVVMESRELRGPPDIAAALALDCQGLSTKDRPPLSEHSYGFLGGEGTLAQGADERAREPRASRAGGAPCLVVSCHLHDSVGGVGDSAPCPLVGRVPRSPRALDAWQAG
jgi:hypothetical protein